MKNKQMNRRAQILISLGVVMVTMPLLLRDFVKVPDFVRGLVIGIGLSLEISGFIVQVRSKKASRCQQAGLAGLEK